MKKNNSNSSIKCSVESCKHNNCEEGTCELEEIKVGSNCNGCDCTTEEETICESFEENEEKTENDEDDSNNDEE